MKEEEVKCLIRAHFEHEAGKELIVAYAATGKASVVVRNMVRDPADLAAALLTNCGGDDRYEAFVK